MLNFIKNIGNDYYLRPLTNQDKDILMNHSKMLTNLTLTDVKKKYCLIPDGKGLSHPQCELSR